MTNPDLIFGRLGNRMFQMAALWSLTKDKDINMFGDWLQNEKYFKKYQNDIKQLFGQDIGYVPYVSIHVRRNDYLKPPHNNFHTNLCVTDYYDQAIKLFPDDKFIVFSDDIKWCKDNFKGEKFVFVEGNTEIEDMNMMASCSKGNIIANSTFSWWAGWLNPNPAKKVVCPDETCWFYDKEIRTVCPKDWIRIKI